MTYMLLTNSRYETRGQARYGAHNSLASGFEKYHAEQAVKQAVKQAEREANSLSGFVDPETLTDGQKEIVKSYTDRANGMRTLSKAYAGLADNGYKRKENQ